MTAVATERPPRCGRCAGPLGDLLAPVRWTATLPLGRPWTSYGGSSPHWRHRSGTSGRCRSLPHRGAARGVRPDDWLSIPSWRRRPLWRRRVRRNDRAAASVGSVAALAGLVVVAAVLAAVVLGATALQVRRHTRARARRGLRRRPGRAGRHNGCASRRLAPLPQQQSGLVGRRAAGLADP